MYKETWRKKHGIYYNDSIITVDTETSKRLIQEKTRTQKELWIGWIHSWKMCIDGEIYEGTKPSEICNFLLHTTEHFRDDQKIIVFIHNLPYDFQYLKDFLCYYFGTPSIMATQPRKPFKVSFDHVEFRCSYKLSNKSLEMWGNDLQVEHKKAVGLYDYDSTYFQDTYTETEEQKLYTDNDVLCQYECILKTMQLHGKKHVADLPLTSTGFVREEIANIFRKQEKKTLYEQYRLIQDRTCTQEIYDIIETLRHGGYTHGNFFLSGHIQTGNIRHRDFKSHYPSQMLIHKYPVEYPHKVECIDWTPFNFKRWFSLNRKTMYCFIEILVKDLQVKPGIAFPTLSCSHVIKCGNPFNKSAVLDNGRVMKWDNTIHLYLSDVDFLLLKKLYNGKFKVLNVYAGRKDYLPKYIQDAVKKFYYNKRYYKVLEKQAKKGKDIGKAYIAAVNLLKSKNEINGIFGVCYTNPVRSEYYLKGEMNQWHETEKPPADECIEKLTDTTKQGSIFFWLWGLYVAAYGVWELHEYIDLIGQKNAIYCDTDSLFYFSTPEIEKRIEDRNKLKQLSAEQKQAYIMYEGQKDIFDLFSDEGENITRFIFGHAKCYAYECDGELNCTIAGVCKRHLEDMDDEGKPIYIYSHEELQTLENFVDGFTFKKCGGTIAKYYDDIPHIENIDGHETEIASCCIIQETTKKIQVNMYE